MHSSAISGYVVGITKNTFPENAPLRNKVNAAQQAYDAAEQTYDDLALEYCGHILTNTNQCDTTASRFAELDAAFDKLLAATDIYIAALIEAEDPNSYSW